MKHVCRFTPQSKNPQGPAHSIAPNAIYGTFMAPQSETDRQNTALRTVTVEALTEADT